MSYGWSYFSPYSCFPVKLNPDVRKSLNFIVKHTLHLESDEPARSVQQPDPQIGPKIKGGPPWIFKDFGKSNLLVSGGLRGQKWTNWSSWCILAAGFWASTKNWIWRSPGCPYLAILLPEGQMCKTLQFLTFSRLKVPGYTSLSKTA